MAPGEVYKKFPKSGILVIGRLYPTLGHLGHSSKNRPCFLRPGAIERHAVMVYFRELGIDPLGANPNPRSYFGPRRIFRRSCWIALNRTVRSKIAELVSVLGGPKSQFLIT